MFNENSKHKPKKKPVISGFIFFFKLVFNKEKLNIEKYLYYPHIHAHCKKSV